VDLSPVAAAVAVALTLGAIGYAIVQVARSSDLKAIEKAIWIAAVVCVPLIAAIAWCVAIRYQNRTFRASVNRGQGPARRAVPSSERR
jgi:uncharacterized membrane protein YjdF